MPTKVCKGTDLVIHLTLLGNQVHTFNDIKQLTISLRDASRSIKHIPTATATNQCCNQRQISSSMELKSLVTSSNESQVEVDALFPADLQMVGRVYNVQVVWSEKTDELIADDKVFNFKIDTNKYIEVVSNIAESDIENNDISATYTFESKGQVENPTL